MFFLSTSREFLVLRTVELFCVGEPVMGTFKILCALSWPEC